MGMTVQEYYLIRPKPELIEKVGYRHYCYPTVMETKSSHVETESDIQVMKLTFMLSLTRWENGDDGILYDLLGNPMKFSIETFDQWWTIERIHHESYAVTLNFVTLEDVQNLHKTGDQTVDRWIDAVTEGKLKGSDFTFLFDE